MDKMRYHNENMRQLNNDKTPMVTEDNFTVEIPKDYIREHYRNLNNKL